MRKIILMVVSVLMSLNVVGCSVSKSKDEGNVESIGQKNNSVINNELHLDAKKEVEAIKNASIGEYVTFGRYEQDNDGTNGKEEIEWIVLNEKDNKVLLISKYILDLKPYNEYQESITYEICSLRAWLNNDFFNEAFVNQEKEYIETVTVEAHKNPKYYTNPGNDTQDKMFLLSLDEVYEYFDCFGECDEKVDKDEVVGKLTPYGLSQEPNGVMNVPYKEFSWWLRTPGEEQDEAAVVYDTGLIYERGGDVRIPGCGVRPALWLSLES